MRSAISRFPSTSHHVLFPVAAVALSAGLGGLAARTPIFALGVACLILSLTLTQAPFVRLVALVIGGMAAFQSSDSLSLSKAGYLAVGGLVIAIAVRNQSTLQEGADWPGDRLLSRWTYGGFLFVGYAFGLAFVDGTRPTSALRDLAPYLLMASAAAVSVDAAHYVRPGLVKRLLVGAGALAALSFAVTWIARRHLGLLPVDHLLLPSSGLALAVVTYALAHAYLIPVRRTSWSLLAGAVAALLIVTGTRSALVVIAVPLILWIAGGRKRGAVLVRFAVSVAAVSAVVAVSLSFAGVIDGSAAVNRLFSIRAIATNPNGDGSFRERREETAAALERFSARPFTGAGPGIPFTWQAQGSSLTKTSLTIDSPASYLAKFGLLGLLFLGGFVVLLWRLLRSFPEGHELTDDQRVAHLAVSAVMVLWLCALPFGFPFEDKGWAFGLMLMLALMRGSRSDERGLAEQT